MKYKIIKSTYLKDLYKFRNCLFNIINFLKTKARTYFILLLDNMCEEVLIDSILIKPLLRLNYKECYSLRMLQNIFVNCFKDYMSQNLTFVKYNIRIISKAFAYIVYILTVCNIIVFDSNTDLILLTSYIKFSLKEIIIFTFDKWPLLNLKEYNKHSIDKYIIDKYYFISEKVIYNINRLQSIKYFLVKNPKIIKVIEEIEKFLTVDFLNKHKSNAYLEDWYVCYQYLILIKLDIEHIYYSYNLKEKGKIVNTITFGLNPMLNELSKVLIGFGKVYLNEISILNLKKYICTSFEIDLNSFDSLMNINLDFKNKKNIERLLCRYSLKSLILLLDWKENVLKNNYTEMPIQLTSFESGSIFLMANDYNGMLNTDLIQKGNNLDLHEIILYILYNKSKLNWFNILNKNFIKAFMKTKFYEGNSRYKLLSLLKEYKLQYSLTYLFKKNYISLILDSKIISDPYVIEALELLKKRVDMYLSSKLHRSDINYIKIVKLQTFLMRDLKLYRFSKTVDLLDSILLRLYPTTMYFIKILKVLKLEDIKTPYFAFSLKRYSYMQSKSISSICKNMGSYFIKHNFIDFIKHLNIPFFIIGESILCDINHIELIQAFMLKAYRKAYDYSYDYFYIFFNFKHLNIFKNKKYELNSLDIYKIQ